MLLFLLFSFVLGRRRLRARKNFHHIHCCKAETGFSGLDTRCLLGMGQAAPSPQQFPPQPLGTEGHSSVPAEIPIQNTGVFLRWVFLAGSVFTLGSGSYRTETAGHLVPWLPSYNSSSPLLFHKRIQIALKKPKEAVFFSSMDSVYLQFA